MHELRATLLAGGYGKRMGRLGRGRVKPSIPFGTRCHLMDFSLHNAQQSGIDEVLLLSRYHEELLHAYLLETWDASLPIHFGPFNALHHLPAAQVYQQVRRADEHGTADALIQNRPYIQRAPYRDVMVLHSDHVYRFDYRDMYRFHREQGAALTLGFQRIPLEFVSLFGMVEVDAERNLRAFVEKPSQPTSDAVFTAVCIFNQEILYRHLDALSQTAWAHDISRDVIPHMLAQRERIKCYPFDAYWEDIGTAARYHRAHMNLLEGIGVPLEDMPQRLASGGQCVRIDTPNLRQSIAPPATLELADRGRVQIRHSVIFAGAELGAGAMIEDSVLLPGAHVAPGVRVQGSIVCNGERIEADFIDQLE
jgi:valienol-1-phosphate guanylyltransferase